MPKNSIPEEINKESNNGIFNVRNAEYFAYSDFQETEVPVPRLIALEESADVLGAP